MPSLLTWATSDDVLLQAQQLGALAEVEAALRTTYDLTATSPSGRLRPSSLVEEELRKAGWKKTRPWLPEAFSARDSFDGWKQFPDGRGNTLGVAVEIQWVLARHLQRPAQILARGAW
jgi:hypothetical protein